MFAAAGPAFGSVASAPAAAAAAAPPPSFAQAVEGVPSLLPRGGAVGPSAPGGAVAPLFQAQALAQAQAQTQTQTQSLADKGGLDSTSGATSATATTGAFSQSLMNLLSMVDLSVDVFRANVLSTSDTELHLFDTSVRKQCDEVGARAGLSSRINGPSLYRAFIHEFLNEHYQIHTRQASRSLSDADLEVALWIKRLYGRETVEDASNFQRLPYERTAVNFWRHWLAVEKTVKGLSFVWALESPRLFYGFLSFAQADSMLRGTTNSYLFRLSNSNPDLIVLSYCVNGVVAQSQLPAFKTMADFLHFLGTNSITAPSGVICGSKALGSQSLIPTAKVIEVLKSDRHVSEVERVYRTKENVYRLMPIPSAPAIHAPIASPPQSAGAKSPVSPFPAAATEQHPGTDRRSDSLGELKGPEEYFEERAAVEGTARAKPMTEWNFTSGGADAASTETARGPGGSSAWDTGRSERPVGPAQYHADSAFPLPAADLTAGAPRPALPAVPAASAPPTGSWGQSAGAAQRYGSSSGSPES